MVLKEAPSIAFSFLGGGSGSRLVHDTRAVLAQSLWGQDRHPSVFTWAGPRPAMTVSVHVA